MSILHARYTVNYRINSSNSLTIKIMIYDSTIQPELDLISDGVVRYVWKFSFGDILIEVFPDNAVTVNRKQVAPFIASAAAPTKHRDD
jgi:hypothetical protein